jgi:thiamine-phosphate pyrophosphorylase
LPSLSKTKGIYRVIDANINRTKEGLRVCEEITRFVIDDRNLTSQFKKIRHQVDSVVKNLRNNPRLLDERESLKDVGRTIKNRNELKRVDFRDIFFANIQRVKESIRVLEEFSKLDNVNIALKFKDIRYDIYALEKKVIKKLSSLCHHR